uniref:Low density lipoprotein receptor class A domain containing 2 n=1 Tax=Jaculus jaculus TaxID=51337 RepID=A0A8C5KC38_JACJA
MDNCGDGSDQDSLPPASCRGPTWAPRQMQSPEGNTSKPLTLSLALGSTAERGSAAGQAPARQDAVLEGPQLWKVALASSLLLVFTSLLTGFLWWCCCPSRLARPPGASRSRLRCCTACCLCPSRVAPGERWLNRQGGHPC